MTILIPTNKDNFEEATISLLDEVQFWLLLEIVEGKVIEYNFYKTKQDIQKWIDIVVVKNDKEYVWPFMEENIAVLMAPFCESIDEIVEAYLYKELHDFNIGM
jgi:hypothetical protein